MIYNHYACLNKINNRCYIIEWKILIWLLLYISFPTGIITNIDNSKQPH